MLFSFGQTSTSVKARPVSTVALVWTGLMGTHVTVPLDGTEHIVKQVHTGTPVSSIHNSDVIIGRDGVSNHQPHDCLLSCLFRRRSKKTSKLRVAGLWLGVHR